MYHLRAFRLFTICLVTGVPLVCFFVSLGLAESPEKTSSERSLYHADPRHVWNRLHEALFVRVGPDGIVYGQDRLEPLLWSDSKHLLEERSHNRAVAVLKEFLDNNGAKLIEDPLKRALLQRDLWLVFNWLEEGDHRGYGERRLKAEVARAVQERLRHPLAAVIGRLALSPKEIRDLPNNYAAAIASGEFARRFDPERPAKPYLPPDLFAADGPWVCVGRTDGRTAPGHLADHNPFTNSVFLVFLRLPAGRAATVDYLKQLLSFDQPLLVKAEGTGSPFLKFLPNPQLPQFPKDTELALVRRALLINSSHRVVASPLTESVQLRVLHGEVPAITAEVFKGTTVSGGLSERRRRVGSWHSFHEFRLSRSQLFAGRAGGLHVVGVGPDERDFKTGFSAHTWDEFEQPLRPDQSFREMTRRIIKNCSVCHSMPGVYSFNSFKADFRFAMERNDGDKDRPLPLAEMPVSDVAGAAIKWKESRPNWTALRKLLAE